MGIVLFEGLRLTTPGTGGDLGPEPTFSRPLASAGMNALSATLTILAIDESDGIAVTVQGTNDLQNWVDLGGIVGGSTIGATQGQLAGLATAYVRVAVVETSADPASATLSLTVDLSIL